MCIQWIPSPNTNPNQNPTPNPNPDPTISSNPKNNTVLSRDQTIVLIA